MADLTDIRNRVAALLAGTTPTPPPDDSYVLRSAFDSETKPTRGQFLKAVEASGSGRVSRLAALVPSNRSSPINIAWNHSGPIKANGVLANFVRDSLPISDAAIAALITQAKTLSE